MFLRRLLMVMSPDILEKLSLYRALLLKWSKAINLVSPSTLKDSDQRHFSDSLQLLKYIPEEVTCLIDIGSGAGFPGMVLAVARPGMAVHLVESDQKKCAFLSAVSRETFIPVTIHNERVENVDISKISPQVVTARALASLIDLLTLTEEWWSGLPNLVLLFPKGARAEAEIAEARRKFFFDVEVFPSKTDAEAVILRLKNVSRESFGA